MRKLFVLLLVSLLLISCKTQKAKNEILSPSNLTSQLFSINPATDTVLQTSHAAILKIKKGSFSGDKTITIEIKEAYRPDEILLAGLTTVSDGRSLRSAGMIYFNATVDGFPVEPLLPIETTIPAKQTDPEMMVFKGEEDDDGNINWVEPQTIDTTLPNDLVNSIDNGKQLFSSKCASCHHIFKAGTGPALQGLQNRGPWRNPVNVLAWVRNPSSFMSVNDYTQQLKRQYGSMMTGFADLNINDIKNLLNYINYTSGNGVLAEEPDDFENCWKFDTTYSFVKDTFPEYDTTSDSMVSTDNNATFFPDTNFYVKKDYDKISTDLYKEGYTFNIKDNGWFNIDAFLKMENTNIENVRLIAELKMSEATYMNVYILVPAERVLQNTNDKKGNQYYFDYDNGKIPLPLSGRAIILAFGSTKEKILYGISEFTINMDQIIPVEIKETTADELKKLLTSKNVNGIELEAFDKKMEISRSACTDSIKKIKIAAVTNGLNPR